MGYYCLPIEPYVAREQDFPTRKCWVEITKEYNKPSPTDGKTKLTKEQLKEYNDMISKRKEMFKRLEAGHYNCFNQPIEGRDITRSVGLIFNGFNNYVYRIKPTSSKALSKQSYSYTTDKDCQIYEFDVVKQCNTKEELLQQLYKDRDLIRFMREVFDNGKYENENYKQICIDTFKYCKDSFKDLEINISDLIFAKYKSYEKYARYVKDESLVESFALELLGNGCIQLHGNQDYENTQNTFYALITSKWFNIANQFVQILNDSHINSIKNNKDFERIVYILKTNGDNENIKQIVKKLKCEESVLTLKVFTYNADWDDRLSENDQPLEVKTFKTIDEVRAYLVMEYKVPVIKASGDIVDFEYWADEYNGKHFIVE